MASAYGQSSADLHRKCGGNAVTGLTETLHEYKSSFGVNKKINDEEKKNLNVIAYPRFKLQLGNIKAVFLALKDVASCVITTRSLE